MLGTAAVPALVVPVLPDGEKIPEPAGTGMGFSY